MKWSPESCIEFKETVLIPVIRPQNFRSEVIWGMIKNHIYLATEQPRESIRFKMAQYQNQSHHKKTTDK